MSGTPGRLTTLDRLTLIYVGATTLALALSFRDGPIRFWPLLLLAHAGIAACALLAPRLRRGGAVGRLLGDVYPLLLLAGLYGEIGIYTLHRGVVHDAAIQALEQWVFGAQISTAWIRALPSPTLSWVLHLCYLSYYPILAAATLGLWALGRRDAARAAVLGIMATFYAHYTVFIFFPVAGPRYFFPLAVNAATAVWPAHATQTMLNGVDSWGAAFPSSHVAAAVVAAGMAWRGSQWLGLILWPLTIGLTLSVVYGQFHYGVDALAGLLAGVGVLGLLARHRRQANPSSERRPAEVSR